MYRCVGKKKRNDKKKSKSHARMVGLKFGELEISKSDVLKMPPIWEGGVVCT